MVQSACQYVEVYRFGRASKISGYNKITIFGNFAHFGLKIEPLCFKNLTQNPCDCETRAQELTSGAIRMWLSFFVKIWELFKEEGYEGYSIRRIWWSILIFFTIFDISPLWMDQFGRNWWPNWRFFDALTESAKIFDRYDLQIFRETLEAGSKKWIFMPLWLLWSQN